MSNLIVMDKLTVLVTGLGSSNAISVIKGLRQQDRFKIRIVGIDTNVKNRCAGAFFSDVFYNVPLAQDSRYLSEVLDICKKEKIDVIIPIIDEELLPLASNAEKFTRIGVKLMLSSASTIELCANKLKTYNFFKDNAIPTPETWTCPEDEISPPVIFKPVAGRGSRQIHIAWDEFDLTYGLSRYKGHIIQRFVEGQEITVDVFSDYSGQPLAIVPRERLQTKAGVCYKGITIRNQIVEKICIDICRKMKIVGACNIQCIIGTDGTPYFIEVNPRFSSALPLTAAAGINLPLLTLRLARGEKISPLIGRQKEGVVMLRYWEEVFV